MRTEVGDDELLVGHAEGRGELPRNDDEPVRSDHGDDGPVDALIALRLQTGRRPGGDRVSVLLGVKLAVLGPLAGEVGDGAADQRAEQAEGGGDQRGIETSPPRRLFIGGHRPPATSEAADLRRVGLGGGKLLPHHVPLVEKSLLALALAAHDDAAQRESVHVEQGGGDVARNRCTLR